MKCPEEMEQGQEARDLEQPEVGVEPAAGAAVGEVVLGQDRSNLAFAPIVRQRPHTREGRLALSKNALSAEPS